MHRAEMLAWKSWRAGRAICMAAQGDSLGTILTAGEWKSAAFLKYIDEDAVDKMRMLHSSVDSSDEEALPVL